MIIDFHTHIFPDKVAERAISGLQANSNNMAYTDGTYNGLVSEMEKSNVDISVALPVLTKPTQFDSVLDFAIMINEKNKSSNKKVISFCGMHPDTENVEEKLKRAKLSGIKGIKIHPDYQGTFIDDERYIKILKVAKDNDLIVVTHSGIDEGYKGCPVRCTPQRVINVIKKVGHNKFILGHYGAHKMWQETLEILAGQNVYFDTAFTFNSIDKTMFTKILEKHGEDKILFATDSPWQSQKENVATLKSFNLSTETEDKIFYKNAKKLLNL